MNFAQDQKKQKIFCDTDRDKIFIEGKIKIKD